MEFRFKRPWGQRCCACAQLTTRQNPTITVDGQWYHLFCYKPSSWDDCINMEESLEKMKREIWSLHLMFHNTRAIGYGAAGFNIAFAIDSILRRNWLTMGLHLILAAIIMLAWSQKFFHKDRNENDYKILTYYPGD